MYKFRHLGYLLGNGEVILYNLRVLYCCCCYYDGKEICKVEANGETTEREALYYEGLHFNASL